MTTATKIADNRGKLLADLKRYLTSKKKAQKLLDGISVKIWVATYAWVEAAVAHGQAESRGEAVEKLANSLREAPANVSTWQSFGKFMRKNRINPKGVKPEAIRRAYVNYNALTPTEQGKVMHAVKAEGTASAVSKVLGRSPGYRIKMEDRRLNDHSRNQTLNRTTMKMEMRAWQHFAETFFGEHCAITIKGTKSKKVLMQANGEVT